MSPIAHIASMVELGEWSPMLTLCYHVKMVSLLESGCGSVLCVREWVCEQQKELEKTTKNNKIHMRGDVSLCTEDKIILIKLKIIT